MHIKFTLHMIAPFAHGEESWQPLATYIATYILALSETFLLAENFAHIRCNVLCTSDDYSSTTTRQDACNHTQRADHRRPGSPGGQQEDGQGQGRGRDQAEHEEV